MIGVAVYFSLPLNRLSKTHGSNVSGRMVMIPNDEWRMIDRHADVPNCTDFESHAAPRSSKRKASIIT